MKPIYLSLLLGLFVTTSAFSQQTVTKSPRTERGYVYLKDGTVLKGKYIYSPDLEKIRVTTKSESRVYDVEDIEKVSSSRPIIDEKPSFVSPSRRFMSLTEGGVLLGNPDNANQAPFVLGTSVNYTIKEGLSAGIGTGVEFYNGTYLPVTANLHYRFGSDRVTPFVMLQVGYLIALESSFERPYDGYYNSLSSYYPNYSYGSSFSYYGSLDAKGGFLVNPSVGMIIETDYGFGVSLSVGYRYHRLKYEGEGNDYRLHIDYNRLSLKLGIIF